MSNSIDGGRTVLPPKDCPKGGEHQWVEMGHAPFWKKCEKCGEVYYSK